MKILTVTDETVTIDDDSGYVVNVPIMVALELMRMGTQKDWRSTDDEMLHLLKSAAGE